MVRRHRPASLDKQKGVTLWSKLDLGLLGPRFLLQALGTVKVC